jgi:phage terminase small subunit
MALTDGKHRFAVAKLDGKSNKEAAVAAGYSERTASQAGSRLVKDKDVLAYLERHALAGSPPAREPGAPPRYEVVIEYSDPMEYLTHAMNDKMLEDKLRIQAARALIPFKHAKKGEAGKKEALLEAAKAAGGGPFGAPPAPPRLVASSKK